MISGQRHLPVRRTWVWATIFGLSFGFAAFSLLAPWLAKLGDNVLLASEIYGIIVFLPMGVLQGLILRSFIKNTHWWMISTSMGWTVYWILSSTLIPMLNQALVIIFFDYVLRNLRGRTDFFPIDMFGQFNVFTGAWLGFSIGLVQWIILRKVIPRPRLWIIINVLAFAVAMPVIAAILPGYGARVVSVVLYFSAAIIAGLFGGLIIGVVTRVGLTGALLTTETPNLGSSG